MSMLDSRLRLPARALLSLLVFAGVAGTVSAVDLGGGNPPVDPPVDPDIGGDLTNPPNNGGTNGNPTPPVVNTPIDLKFNTPFGNLNVGGAILLGGGVLAMGWLGFSVLGTKFVTSQNVLENDARRDLFEFIKTNPGTHLRATAQALGLSTTNALWHLRKLEQSNLISSKRLDGYKVFYPVEGGLEAKRMGLAMAVLRNPNAKQIIEHVSTNPSAHQREMARALGLNHGTIRWHLKKLAAVELVTELRKDHTSQYFISDLGNLALARIKGVPISQLPPVPAIVVTLAPAQIAETAEEAAAQPISAVGGFGRMDDGTAEA
jgi:predicted transcriptional regulator